MTTDEWAAILHLAAKWKFETIKVLAIERLSAIAPPIDKITLGKQYGIVEWLADAYKAICKRPDPLTIEEGTRLGLEDVIRISAMRQAYNPATLRTFFPEHFLAIFALNGRNAAPAVYSSGSSRQDLDRLEKPNPVVPARWT